MLGTLDIALTCDSVRYGSGGEALCPDHSRHGAICYIGSDGLTAAQMPTLDALNGLFTFDGGDFLIMPHDGNSPIVQSIGAAQEETIIMCFDPWVFSSGVTTVLFMKDDSGASGKFLRIRKTVGDEIDFRADAGGGSFELVSTAGGEPAAFDGKRMTLICIRATDRQEIWIDDALVASDTDTTVDASNPEEVGICASNVIGTNAVPAGTGLSGFGYERRAWTPAEIFAFNKYLREVL